MVMTRRVAGGWRWRRAVLAAAEATIDGVIASLDVGWRDRLRCELSYKDLWDGGKVWY